MEKRVRKQKMAEILRRQEIIYEREEREGVAATAITNKRKWGKKQEKIWGKVGKCIVIIMHINQSINVAIIIYPIQDTQFFFFSLFLTLLLFIYFYYFIYYFILIF
jgi:hypothetical protein